MAKYLRTKETEEIYRMLDFHLRYAPFGLLPFMDKKYPLPSEKDVFDILNTLSKYAGLDIKVKGGNNLPEQQIILERTEPYLGMIKKRGGIMLIRKVFSEVQKRSPAMDKFLRDWSKKGTGNLKTVMDVAINNGYNNASAAYKVKDKFLREISYEIYARRPSYT